MVFTTTYKNIRFDILETWNVFWSNGRNSVKTCFGSLLAPLQGVLKPRLWVRVVNISLYHAQFFNLMTISRRKQAVLNNLESDFRWQVEKEVSKQIWELARLLRPSNAIRKLWTRRPVENARTHFLPDHSDVIVHPRLIPAKCRKHFTKTYGAHWFDRLPCRSTNRGCFFLFVFNLFLWWCPRILVVLAPSVPCHNPQLPMFPAGPEPRSPTASVRCQTSSPEPPQAVFPAKNVANSRFIRLPDPTNGTEVVLRFPPVPPPDDVCRWLNNDAPRVNSRLYPDAAQRPSIPVALLAFFDGALSLDQTAHLITNKQSDSQAHVEEAKRTFHSTNEADRFVYKRTNTDSILCVTPPAAFHPPTNLLGPIGMPQPALAVRLRPPAPTHPVSRSRTPPTTGPFTPDTYDVDFETP